MKTYSSLPGAETLSAITCNLCGSNLGRKYLDCGAFYYLKCRQCGLIYQEWQPQFTDLQQRYKENYFSYEKSNEENFFHLMQLGLTDIGFNKLTAEFRENRNFLDLGCATGMLLAYMQQQGWQTHGVDICRESAEYGIRQRGLDIFTGPLDKAGFPDRYFSVIHFSHLIEHVPEPAALLKEVYRILAPTGIVILTTPNADGFQAKLLRSHWRSAIADHLFLFTKKTMAALLIRTGFKLLQVITWGGLAKGLGPGFVKKPLDFLAKKCGFGDVMLILAAKDTASAAGSE